MLEAEALKLIVLWNSIAYLIYVYDSIAENTIPCRAKSETLKQIFFGLKNDDISMYLCIRLQLHA